MTLFKQQSHSVNLSKWIFLLAFMVGFSTIMIAQNKTAASVYNEGLAKLKEKDYVTGFPLIEEALKLAEAEGNEKVVGLAKKNGAKAAYNLGSSKRKAKAYDEALTLFDRGIELNPQYSSNYMGRAQALGEKGNKKEAVTAYLVASDFAEKAGKTDRAVKLAKKAGSIIGKLYSNKDYDQAIAAGQAHLEVKESATVNYYLAKSFEKQKKSTDALPHINKAVEIAEAGGAKAADKYYWAQGGILESVKKKSEATAAYQKITGEKYKANAEFRIKELSGSK